MWFMLLKPLIFFVFVNQENETKVTVRGFNQFVKICHPYDKQTIGNIYLENLLAIFQ